MTEREQDDLLAALRRWNDASHEAEHGRCRLDSESSILYSARMYSVDAELLFATNNLLTVYRRIAKVDQ
jgi:hypothetical protein